MLSQPFFFKENPDVAVRPAFTNNSKISAPRPMKGAFSARIHPEHA